MRRAVWGNPAKASPYPKSKILAEKAAWELHASWAEPKPELVTVLPGFVMGPFPFKVSATPPPEHSRRRLRWTCY